jgi:hypothetical protein
MKATEMGCPFYREWLVRSCSAKGMVLDPVIALEFCKGDEYRKCQFMRKVNVPVTDVYSIGCRVCRAA